MRKSILAAALVTAVGSVAAQTVTPPTVSPGTVTSPSVGPGGATIQPMNPPTLGSGGATTPEVAAPSIATNPPMATGVGLGSEAQARARVERDGYTGVAGLTKGPDGVWRGMAMRGSTSVQVMVDARGNVLSQ